MTFSPARMRLQEEFISKFDDILLNGFDIIFPQFRSGPDHFVFLRDWWNTCVILFSGHGDIDHVLVDAFLPLCGQGIDPDV